MEDYTQTMNEERGPRPGFLTTLCVLTFISTGLSTISNLFSLIAGPLSDEQLKDVQVTMMEFADQMKSANLDSVAEVYEKLFRIQEATNANHYAFVLSTLVILGVGIFAAIKMMKGSKLGFHLYIIYSLLSVVQLYFFVSASIIPTFMVVTNLVFALLFIFLYSRNLKWMR